MFKIVNSRSFGIGLKSKASFFLLTSLQPAS